MKKVLFILVSCLLLVGCKTKQVNTDKLRVNETQNFDYLALMDYLKKNQSTKEVKENDIKELKELFSNLNINYTGEDINDKLDVLLKKTSDGATQLTLQGKGTAKYTESNKQLIERFQKYLKSYQDSIQEVNAQSLEQMENRLFAKIDAKEKQVDSSGFSPVMWLAIIITAVVMVCLNWLKNQLKPFLKKT